MSKIRILLVEDETDVMKLNARHLTNEGYEVICARTIAEARAQMWERPPDLIILDVLMPDGSGYDFCASIRKMTTAPIIYLTAMSAADDIIRGLIGGGDDYITKPYNLEVLSARIMAQLRRAGFGSLGRIEMPPLFIDLAAGRVTLDGESINLTHKELQLLALFADNAGRSLSAEEIYTRVWQNEQGVKSNTVRVHISTLRGKLKLDDASPFELTLTQDKRYVFQKVKF